MWSDDSCLETDWWQDRAGYGRRYVRGSWPDQKYEYHHRVVLEQKLGRSLLDGMDALHHCDNPPCYQQSHVYEGTDSDNHRDAVVRGRLRPGGVLVLSRDVREEIRVRYLESRDGSLPHRGNQGVLRGRAFSMGQLGLEYGISRSAVSRIVNREGVADE